MTTTKRVSLTCGKCNGTGSYLHLGSCFACNGTGRLLVTAAEAARIERAKSSGAAYTAAVRVLRAGGIAAARAFVAANRDDLSALNAMLAALHGEDYTDEGAALHGWIARRFPVAA